MEKERNAVFEDKSSLYLSNNMVKLTFSKRTGHWIGLEYLPNELTLIDSLQEKGSFLFRVGREKPSTRVRDNRGPSIEVAQEIGKHSSYSNYTYRDSGRKAELCVCSKEKEWEVWQSFILTSGSSIIERGIFVKYSGDKEIKLQDVFLNLSNLKIKRLKECYFQAPGCPIRPNVPAEEIPEGGWEGIAEGSTAPLTEHVLGTMDSDVPGWLPGVFSLSNPVEKLAIFCWAYTPEEPSFMYPEKERGTITFCQRILCADYFRQGRFIATGKQFIQILCGDWNRSLEKFHNLCQEKAGFERCAKEENSWRRAAIYEAHIGKAVFPEGEYEPFPTVEDLTAYLPKIRDFGFDIILLMPRQPYPSYTVHDFYDITTSFGEEKALKSLVRKAHTMGVRVILDVLLHGCTDKKAIQDTIERIGTEHNYLFDIQMKIAPERSFYREKHDDWFMRTEDGRIAMTYTLAFDSANEDWQEYIIKVLEFYIERLDVDGFRFDAPTWNFFPSWDRSLPYRPSQSIYGAAKLFSKARAHLKKIRPDVIFYTEPSGPLFRKDFDLNYNYDEHWLFGSILGVLSNPQYPGPFPWERYRQINAENLAQWLENRKFALPVGGKTVHHIDSHDTFWRYHGHLPREVLGLEASKALFALCAFLDGGIMAYTGSEKDMEIFMRKILHLRKSLPEMRWGRCEYTTIKSSDNMVLPLFWQFEDNYSIPVINFKNSSVAVNIYLPIDRINMEKENGYLIWDAFNNRIVPCTSSKRISLKMPAYGVSVLVIRKYESKKET